MLPTETKFGIPVNIISVTMPDIIGFAGTSSYNVRCSVLIPILKELFNPLTYVVNPLIANTVLFLK